MLRPFEDADLDDLLLAWEASFRLAHPFIGDEFIDGERRNIPELYLPNTENWVWEAEGRVVGFLALMGNEVGGLFLDPAWHGQGIGRALMDQARSGAAHSKSRSSRPTRSAAISTRSTDFSASAGRSTSQRSNRCCGWRWASFPATRAFDRSRHWGRETGRLREQAGAQRTEVPPPLWFSVSSMVHSIRVFALGLRFAPSWGGLGAPRRNGAASHFETPSFPERSGHSDVVRYSGWCYELSESPRPTLASLSFSRHSFMDQTPPPNLFVRTFTQGGLWRFHGKTADSYRETAEGVAFAVILAFLFKAFLGEAFIIPTGSMAATLQGRHMDVTCPKCGNPYRVGASVENDEPGQAATNALVKSGLCPVCHYRMEFDRDDPNQRSFAGDRIIVSKFHYDLYEPERFHVIVFKYPGNAKQNYIKRLIGLPMEMLRIYGGNVHRSPLLFQAPGDETLLESLRRGVVSEALRQYFSERQQPLSAEVVVESLSPNQRVDEAWRIFDPTSQRDYYLSNNDVGLLAFGGDYQILRKPPYKVQAMLQLVHDTRYVADELVQAGWPSQWRAMGDDDASSWSVVEGGRRFDFKATGDQPHWLAYEHFLPDQGDWNMIEQGEFDPALANRNGQLITDEYAYNEGVTTRDFRMPVGRNDVHWVSDLAVEANVTVKSKEGRLLVELVRAGVRFQCSLNAADGAATLEILNDRGLAEFWNDDSQQPAPKTPTAKTSFGQGGHRLRLANVDNRLTLWLDGSVVEFDSPTTYRFEETASPVWTEEDPGDLKPARIAAQGMEGSLERIRMLRDVYYIATACEDGSYFENRTDYSSEAALELDFVFDSPQSWASAQIFASRREVFFFLGPDQFFPMGDNSPQSKDARLWAENSCDIRAARPFARVEGEGPPPPYVHRKYLIGEALVVYWPHAWRFPWTKASLPGLPNFAAMKLIR